MGTQLFYNDTNVTNGVIYYYEVSAKNAIGEGPRSNEIIAKPNASKIVISKTTPTHPRKVKISAGDSFINLSWIAPHFNGNSTIINYRIYRGTISGRLKFNKLVENINHFNDTIVSNGVTYFYRVAAVNKVGEGALSNEIFATPIGSLINDSDSDNIPDYWEQLYGLNISNPNDAMLDSDNDNLTNFEEFLNNTNPWDQDSDNDNITDGDEIKSYGTDALNPDSDGDNFFDGVEIENKTNPLDNTDYPEITKKEDKSELEDLALLYFSIIVLFIIILFLFSLMVIKHQEIKKRRKNE
jgi:hypothetical protein